MPRRNQRPAFFQQNTSGPTGAAEDTMRPTLRTIAQAAGVSPGTVSLALRDNPLTSRATRERIKSLAVKMGYHPDPRVAKLMSYLQQRKHAASGEGTIAFVSSFAQRDMWRDSVTWTDYYKGAEEKTAALGYRLEHFWLREPGVSPSRLSQIMRARGIEGLLIAPTPQSHREMNLKWEWFSTVTFGYSLQRPRVNRVAHSHFHGVTLATAELRARGYNRIGLVVGPDHDNRVVNLWSAGFLAFKSIVDPKHAVPLFRGELKPKPFLEWFRRYKPDAVLSDELVVVRMLAEAGYRVPHDCAFATLDWLQCLGNFGGINQHSRDIGAAAAKQVISALQRDERGIPLRPEVLLLEGCWADGPSTPPNNKTTLPKTAPLIPDWLVRSEWH